jgi:hypothetical protein
MTSNIRVRTILMSIAGYIVTDGIYPGLRSKEDKHWELVVIEVNEIVQKQFLAIVDGVRGSTQSWREILMKLKTVVKTFLSW